MPTPLGLKIRALRKEKSLTLEQLATATGSSKSYIWELENKDELGRPSAEKIARLAAEFDVTPEFLLDEKLTSPTDSDRDEAFFRQYRGLTHEKKKQIKQILDVLDNEE
ncbi:MAG: helix-turn-helix domain-containing protein [Candidatus Thiodiazotropha sp. (ex Lucinoma borealis)]|nr:helix-turn-helix domain-containing protein [Candidatus Thiodiazotropha sp. (ex Lucinoma borealis)]